MISISIVRITEINAICLRQMILNSSKFKVCVITVWGAVHKECHTLRGKGVSTKRKNH